VTWLERTVAMVILIAAAPLLMALCLAVGVLSGRTPLVAIGRTGRGGSPLGMLKLRTMWPRGRMAFLPLSLIEHIEERGVPRLKSAVDARVSSGFALLCRRYSLDELPQLWHVVKGEMSLVGPRPLTIHELREHYGADAATVLQVKPGMTGLWQTRGRSRLSYRQRKRFDLFLAKHNTIGLHAAILIRTVPCVLLGKNAW